MKNTLFRTAPAPLRPVIGAVAILTLGLFGCSGPPSQQPPTAVTDLIPPSAPRTLDPNLLQMPSEPFTLGPGDRVDIEFVGDPTSRASTEVGPDGKIYFYLLPGLDVWGLTLSQASDLIARKSETFMRKPPRVAVTLTEVASRRIWLLGQFNRPGIFPMSGPTTLLQAIAEAGGPAAAAADTEVAPVGPSLAEADLRRSFIMRRGQMLPIDFEQLIQSGDLSQNIYLEPGDFVYLPSVNSNAVHVLGAVASPGSVTSGHDLTLVQTIASAGGTIQDAYLTHVAIVRGSLTQPKISIVDYNAIVRGLIPDVLLQPHDIVYVPYTPYRTLTRYMDLILVTFAQTVGVNEGARAIDSHAGPVGVNVQVAP